MPRGERLRRASAPALGVIVAAGFWIVVALAWKPLDGGGLALWAAITAIFVAPVCVLVMLPLGLRLRSSRRGFTQGVIMYSVLAVAPLVISAVRG
jgi:hypothetical protein